MTSDFSKRGVLKRHVALNLGLLHLTLRRLRPRLGNTRAPTARTPGSMGGLLWHGQRQARKQPAVPPHPLQGPRFDRFSRGRGQFASPRTDGLAHGYGQPLISHAIVDPLVKL